VTHQELIGAGLTREAIRHQRRVGALIPEYRGVYRAGHQAPSIDARYMAAVKACGAGAVLGGIAAAYLLGVTKGAPPSPEVITRAARRIPGLRTRRCRRIDRRDVSDVRGIPVTTVPRTLVDLAAVLDPEDLARAVHEAQVRYTTTPRRVDAALSRRPNSRGAAKLRAVLRGDTQAFLSQMERQFPVELREAGLPLPQMNKPADGRFVDCRWPEYRVTVELISYRYHHSRHAWEQDQQREREARARGDEFRTFTWRDIFEDTSYMLAELRKLLRHKRPD
jgi:hypothetical protein